MRTLLFVVFLPLIWHPQPAQLRGAGDTYDIPTARAKLRLDWWHDWSPQPGSDGIPMVWCASQLGQALDGNRQWVMGWNEPDVQGQCNKSPLAGAIGQKRLEEMHPHRRIVSPGVLDLEWLKAARAEYVRMYGTAPRWDAIGLHCYGFGVNAHEGFSQCKAVIGEALGLARTWGIGQVWLTEFGLVNPDSTEVARFMALMLDWLQTQPQVTRFAWFQTYYDGSEPWSFGPNVNTSLWDGQQLTALGRQYVQ